VSECLLDCVRDDVADWLDLGARLSQVQADLIDPALALSVDERAALGLFAWSYAASGRTRGRRELGWSRDVGGPIGAVGAA
jgi:hypothetical protein